VIDTPAFNLVRGTLDALDDPTKTMPEDSFTGARLAFQEIESDVERLIQELEGNREAERQLRQALEEPVQSTFQRR
jgi:hypothetical protein